MYSLSASQQVNFLSTDFMAVADRSNCISKRQVDGAINIVKIKTAAVLVVQTEHIQV